MNRQSVEAPIGLPASQLFETRKTIRSSIFEETVLNHFRCGEKIARTWEQQTVSNFKN